jgi:hypothetical protein
MTLPVDFYLLFIFIPDKCVRPGSKNITLKDFRITHLLPAHKTSPCTGQPRLSLLLGMYEKGIIKPTKVNKFTLVVNIRRLTSHLFVH